MKTAFDKRSQVVEIKRQVYVQNEDILRDNLNLHRHAIKESRVRNATLHFSAAKIQALIRGFLDRLLCKDIIRERSAAVVIQKIIRGKLGRIRARKVYYQSISVVKSDRALEEILERSTVTREHDGGMKYNWQELYDPLTDTFWYFNKRNNRNTWECPLPFQREMVCMWNGGYAGAEYTSAAPVVSEPVGRTGHRKKGGEVAVKECAAPSSMCCRMVFDRVAEYHNHLRTAHKWFCPACDTKNTAATYPKCVLCGNHRHDTTGVDMMKQFKHDVQSVGNKIYQFLLLDKANEKIDYNMKERMVSVALRRQNQKLEAIWEQELFDKEEEERQKAIQRSGAPPPGTVVSMLAGDETVAVVPMLQKQNTLPEIKATENTTSEARGPRRVKEKPKPPPVAINRLRFHIDRKGVVSTTTEKDTGVAGALPPVPGASAAPGTAGGASRPATGEATSAEFLRECENPNSSSSTGTVNATADKDAKHKKAMEAYFGKSKDIELDPFRFSSIKQAAVAKENAHNELEEKYLNSKFKDPASMGMFPLEEFNIIVKHHPDDHTYYTTDVDEVYDEDPFAKARKQQLALQNGEGGGSGGSKGEEGEEDDEEGMEHYESAEKMAELAKSAGFDGGAALSAHNAKDDASETSSANGNGNGNSKSHKAASNAHTGFSLWSSAETQDKMLVCVKFRQVPCQCPFPTSCPLAHPGVRDQAQVGYTRLPGRVKKVPYVRVCKEWVTNNEKYLRDRAENPQLQPPVFCPHGSDCSRYHVYVRPSTADIIRKLYPVETGTIIKVLTSGSKYDGNTKKGLFHGYGVYTWPGRKRCMYMGDWFEGVRQGFGILRDVTGMEYVGEWCNNVRQGFGALKHPNGEEYLGEWMDGRMEGLGRLTSANGDIYEGCFKDHKYHGMGLFVEGSTGNTYLGYFVDGKAQGMGVLSLASKGEKYKGEFDLNYRHGKGVCCYANGSKYAGTWYRGLPSGFGVYLAPQYTVTNEARGVDKYIGQWDGGMKHGMGRYVFSGGDFYDGEFRFNEAKGTGIYYHTNGNIFKGQWDKSMRNGRGNYMFANGTVFLGSFLDNKIQGKGKMDYANGCFYRGEFEKSRKHGKGIFTWVNGNCYKGQFVYDSMCGPGEMQYREGHVYTGMWDQNKKHGFGVFKYSRNHKYEGMWREDLRHGKGKMTFFCSSFMEEVYEGDWDDDERHGQGTYIYRKDEGCVYSGDWVRGRRHGRGKLSFLDGSFYRGDFRDDQMWGKGIYVDATDGTQYDGEWYKNMRQGFGTLIDGLGTIYHGEFWANMKHGPGQQHNLDGSVYNGKWEGNLVKGTGTVNLPVGTGPLGGPTEIKVKVFGF